MNHRAGRIGAVLAFSALPTLSGQTCTPGWGSPFTIVGCGPWPQQPVVYDDDGAGPHSAALYLAITTGQVQKWDGERFSALPAIPHQALQLSIMGMAAFDVDGPGPEPTALFASTLEASGGNAINQALWKWDGAGWAMVLGPFANTLVERLVAWEGGGNMPRGLYVSLRTNEWPGVSTIVRWDGATTEVPGSHPGAVYAMRFLDDDGPGPRGVSLVIGGANLLSRWDGAGWSDIPGLSGTPGFGVNALAAFDDDVGGPNRSYMYAGGTFSHAGGAPSENLARWNGTGWSRIGAGPDFVAALEVFERAGRPALYIGGHFSSIAGVAAVNTASFSGGVWSPLDEGPEADSYILSLAVFDDDGSGPKRPYLCAGGINFWAPMVGGLPATGIARWSGDRWFPFGQGLDGPVYTCAVYDDGRGPALYAGGEFVIAGGLTTGHIARWNGTAWEALGAGLDGAVYALTKFNDGSGPVLVAGGAFHASGATALEGIARWNGSAWTPLGSGTSGPVRSLATFDGALYAGGMFMYAGGVPVARLARWDGVGWSAVQNDTDGSIDALCVHDEGAGARLFAAGRFTRIGGAPAAYIARWDGTAWSGVGGGMNNWVHALASWGGSLYAGGRFTSAGPSGAVSIARWDGGAWTPLGQGLNNHVDALAALEDPGGPALYVGGKFTSVLGGLLSVDHLARWSGSDWSAVPGGTINGPVSALTATRLPSPIQPSLFIGGDFSSVGATPSPYLAQFNHCPFPCYANCDGSTVAPVLNIGDFVCFLNRFSAQDPWANCDRSTAAPTLNVGDFICYMSSYAAGCP